MNHLRIFNVQAALTKAYSEPLYLSSHLYKSSKESYSEDRVAFAFKNSFGKDVPGVSAGATYDKEDKEDVEKAIFIDDDDLEKGIDIGDVASVAIWFIPGGSIIRGGKALHKLGSMAFNSKRFYKPIKALFGSKKAAQYAKATHEGVKATNQFLTGLRSTKQIKNLNSVGEASLGLIRSAGAGRYGSQGVKAANDFLTRSAGVAGARATRSQGVLGRIDQMVQQGHKLTPAQQTLSNLELFSTVGNLALKPATKVLPKIESARQKAQRAWGAGKAIREGAKRGAANVDKEVIGRVFKGTSLATHTAKIAATPGRPVIVGVPTMPKPKIAEPIQVAEEAAQTGTSALRRFMASAKPVPVPVPKKKGVPVKKKGGPGKKKGPRLFIPSEDGGDQSSRGEVAEGSTRGGKGEHVPLHVSSKGAPTAKVAQVRATKRARQLARAGHAGGRYRFTSEGPVTWKDVQAKTKARA